LPARATVPGPGSPRPVETGRLVFGQRRILRPYVNSAEPGEQFCGDCGQRVAEPAEARPPPEPRGYTPKHLAEKILTTRSALEGERKQVTVLFADVKGSMELGEKVDPEEWYRIMDRFFQILSEGVHRFEGTINQYTGDGFMALVSSPIGHENHAQRGRIPIDTPDSGS
jgi:Adenylate and Guanylate cyclase catalytic domain